MISNNHILIRISSIDRSQHIISRLQPGIHDVDQVERSPRGRTAVVGYVGKGALVVGPVDLFSGEAVPVEGVKELETVSGADGDGGDLGSVWGDVASGSILG
jgi:hypothetical protein